MLDRSPHYNPGIWMSGMDGSNITRIIPNVRAALLTIDHASQLLFWVEEKMLTFCSRESPFPVIYRSDVNGKGISWTNLLNNHPSGLRIVGSRVFWLDKVTFSRSTLTSCEGGEVMGEITHELNDAEADVADFLIIQPTVNSSIPTEGNDNDYCIPDALCSHICIPSATGYMRCFCPMGYKLGPDGWTCGSLS